jgi:hypothetical protein
MHSFDLHRFKYFIKKNLDYIYKYKVMSVLDNSYTSERDSPIRIQSHSLCQDL